MILNLPFSVPRDETQCRLVCSALIGVGWLIFGQTSGACAIFFWIERPPWFTFGSSYPGCVRLLVFTKKPPTLLPFFGTFKTESFYCNKGNGISTSRRPAGSFRTFDPGLVDLCCLFCLFFVCLLLIWLDSSSVLDRARWFL